MAQWAKNGKNSAITTCPQQSQNVKNVDFVLEANITSSLNCAFKNGFYLSADFDHFLLTKVSISTFG